MRKKDLVTRTVALTAVMLMSAFMYGSQPVYAAEESVQGVSSSESVVETFPNLSARAIVARCPENEAIKAKDLVVGGGDILDRYKVTFEDGTESLMILPHSSQPVILKVTNPDGVFYTLNLEVRSMNTLVQRSEDIEIRAVDKTMYATTVLDVHRENHTSSDVILRLNFNEAVHVVGRGHQTGWYHIQLEDGTIGYADYKFLSDTKLDPSLDRSNEYTTLPDGTKIRLPQTQGGGDIGIDTGRWG